MNEGTKKFLDDNFYNKFNNSDISIQVNENDVNVTNIDKMYSGYTGFDIVQKQGPIPPKEHFAIESDYDDIVKAYNSAAKFGDINQDFVNNSYDKAFNNTILNAYESDNGSLEINKMLKGWQDDINGIDMKLSAKGRFAKDFMNYTSSNTLAGFANGDEGKYLGFSLNLGEKGNKQIYDYINSGKADSSLREFVLNGKDHEFTRKYGVLGNNTLSTAQEANVTSRMDEIKARFNSAWQNKDGEFDYGSAAKEYIAKTNTYKNSGDMLKDISLINSRANQIGSNDAERRAIAQVTDDYMKDFENIAKKQNMTDSFVNSMDFKEYLGEGLRKQGLTNEAIENISKNKTVAKAVSRSGLSNLIRGTKGILGFAAGAAILGVGIGIGNAIVNDMSDPERQ